MGEQPGTQLVTPSPLRPGLHAQVWLPAGALVQVAMGWQMPLIRHSSTSVQVVPSPVNPARHTQRGPAASGSHVALSWQRDGTVSQFTNVSGGRNPPDELLSPPPGTTMSMDKPPLPLLPPIPPLVLDPVPTPPLLLALLAEDAAAELCVAPAVPEAARDDDRPAETPLWVPPEPVPLVLPGDAVSMDDADPPPTRAAQ